MYKKNNEILIGSQKRNSDNNIASKKPKKRIANGCKILLGNLSFRSRFDIMEKC